MSALLYRAMIQVVLLFESESWALPDSMIRAVKGNHVGFLRQIMGNQ